MTQNIELISEEDFDKVNIQVGTIISADLNRQAKKPAYKLRIDFGDLGIKTSSAQITHNYPLYELVGKQVIAVVNLPIKKVANVKSEVRILAAINDRQNAIIVEPNIKAEKGTRVY